MARLQWRDLALFLVLALLVFLWGHRQLRRLSVAPESVTPESDAWRLRDRACGNASVGASAGASHIVLMAVGGGYTRSVRRLVDDIIVHTNSDLVVHLLVGPGGAAELIPALPQCDGIAYRVEDGAAMARDAAVMKMCALLGVAPGSTGCLYLVKPFLFQLLPDVDAALVLDNDVRVLGDVRELFHTELAAQRAAGAVLGLGIELQPEYLAVGLGQGYNGGVQLHDLRAMRTNDVYAAFLAGRDWKGSRLDADRALASLGDQTLFTLLNATAAGLTGGAGGRPLIRTLPCGWNLNLCMWHQKTREHLRRQFPWVHVAQCDDGPPRLVHGNGRMYAAMRLGELDDAGLLAIAARIKATGHPGSNVSWARIGELGC